MTDVLRQSFDRLLCALREELCQDWRWPCPDAAFAWYVSRALGVTLPTSCKVQLDSFVHATFEQAPVLAAAGFLLPHGEPAMVSALQASWIAGLRRLAGRKAFTLDRQSFAYRPYEVLGIAVGAVTFATLPAETTGFLRDVISTVRQDGSASTWARLLAIYAGVKLGIPWVSRLWCDIRDLDLCDLAALRWMVTDAAMLNTLNVCDLDDRQITSLLLERALIQGPPRQDVGRCAVVHHAIEAALRQTLGSALAASWDAGSGLPHVIGVLRKICQRFPLYVRQMQKRHAQRPSIVVADEYDTQDCLHSLLVLHFDDVRPEEWAPSYAATSTRMDFLLKNERVVIEVKMTRKGLDQKRLLEELAVDKMRYRSHPDCKALVCFVYDPEKYCHNPVALERDASEAGNFQVVVIVAPHGV